MKAPFFSPKIITKITLAPKGRGQILNRGKYIVISIGAKFLPSPFKKLPSEVPDHYETTKQNKKYKNKNKHKNLAGKVRELEVLPLLAEEDVVDGRVAVRGRQDVAGVGLAEQVDLLLLQTTLGH
jgi:hypothetical protein